MKNNTLTGIPMTPDQYAYEWSVNSKFFQDNSLYEWMSKIPESSKYILEVGCGVGYSTLALSQLNSKNIYVIEENKSLADKTRKLLNEHNISNNLIYLDDIDDALELSTNKVTIIVGDIFSNKIENVFEDINFDLIVCWLIGSSPRTVSININKSVEALNYSDMATYRNNIHSRCYQLASSIVYQGSIHFIDRAEIINSDSLDNYEAEYSNIYYDLAKGNCNLKNIDIAYKKINQSFITSNIQYTNSKNPEMSVLTSVLSSV